MTSTVRGHCPHCGTNKVALEIVKEHNLSKTGGNWQWHAFATCGFCDWGVLLTLETHAGHSPMELCRDGYFPILLSIAPPLPDTGAPAHTPDKVTKFYKQGLDNLALGNWDAAGSMLRKALEFGLKHKFPEMTGDTYKRIETAAENRKLTPDLAEWAHQIRGLGNDATHEDLFEEKDAKEMASFIDLVFRYLFTLPGMLAEARGEPGEPPTQEGPA